MSKKKQNTQVAKYGYSNDRLNKILGKTNLKQDIENKTIATFQDDKRIFSEKIDSEALSLLSRTTKEDREYIVTNAVAQYINGVITLSDTGLDIIDIVMGVKSRNGLQELVEQREILGDLILGLYEIQTKLFGPKDISTVQATEWAEQCENAGKYELKDIKKYILMGNIDLGKLAL